MILTDEKTSSKTDYSGQIGPFIACSPNVALLAHALQAGGSRRSIGGSVPVPSRSPVHGVLRRFGSVGWWTIMVGRLRMKLGGAPRAKRPRSLRRPSGDGGFVPSPFFVHLVRYVQSIWRGMSYVRFFVARHPLAFSLLLSLVLFGLLFLSAAAVPSPVISSVADLPPEALEQPSAWRQALTVVASAQNLFWATAILLAAALLAWLGWWRGAGFNRPSRWRNLRLLVFPLFVGMLALLGGVRAAEPVLLVAVLLGIALAAFGEEVIYRGLLWRALIPKMGAVRAVAVTALLSGLLNAGRPILGGPWPEAVYLTVLAIFSGVAYAALRWRTASIWPVILLHLVFNVAGEISTPGTIPYLRPLLALAIPFVLLGYGLFLLRNRCARADGG